MSKIVRVESVSEDEFKKSNVFQSIAKLYRENDGGVATGEDLKYIYLDLDGNMAEHRFRKLTCNRLEITDAFSHSTSLLGVKVVYEDGKWEYGFKWWDEKDFVSKKKLKSIYMTDGVLNEVSHTIEEFHDGENKKFVPEWIVRKIPFYNERIAAAVNAGDKSIETYDMSLEDWCEVHEAVNFSNRCVVSDSLPYREVNIGGVECKTPIDIKFVSNPPVHWYTKDDDAFRSCVMEEQFGGFSKWIEAGCTVVGINTYLKSLYTDVFKRRNVYRLIPISNLFSIVRENYNRTDGEEYDELWNNLDQAVVGNL